MGHHPQLRVEQQQLRFETVTGTREKNLVSDYTGTLMTLHPNPQHYLPLFRSRRPASASPTMYQSSPAEFDS